jgi:uncharacterized membrane protein (UPF0136 family)
MSYIIFLYSLFIIGGGVFGFRAGSRISLIMSLFFGIVLMAASIANHQQKKWGLFLALITTYVLDSVFLYRFLVSFKFVPPGLFLTVSLCMIILLTIQKNILLKKQ